MDQEQLVLHIFAGQGSRVDLSIHIFKIDPHTFHSRRSHFGSEASSVSVNKDPKIDPLESVIKFIVFDKFLIHF